MGRKAEADEMQKHILSLIYEKSMLQVNIIEVIRRKFGISRSGIRGRLKTLETHKLIIKNKKTKEISLTLKGSRGVQNNMPLDPAATSPPLLLKPSQLSQLPSQALSSVLMPPRIFHNYKDIPINVQNTKASSIIPSINSENTLNTYNQAEKADSLNTTIKQKSDNTKGQKLQIHHFAIAFELRSKLAAGQPQLILQSEGLLTNTAELQNTTIAYMQGGCLTTSSLILFMPHMEFDIHDDPRLAIAPYIELAMHIAQDHELRLSSKGVKLKRASRGTLYAKIIANHNADTENEVARTVLAKLTRFEVRDEQGIIRLIVDNSNGIPEFEAIDAQHAIEDITYAQDFYLALIQGKFDYRKEQDSRMEIVKIMMDMVLSQQRSSKADQQAREQLLQLSSQLLQAQQHQQEQLLQEREVVHGFAREIKSHLGVIHALDRRIEKLNQRRLF